MLNFIQDHDEIEEDHSIVKIDATSQEQACTIISSAIHHLLFAKGQIYQPIKVLQKIQSQKENEITSNECFEGEKENKKGKRIKMKSFNEQRKERMFQEFMIGIEKINEQIITAVNAINHSSYRGNDDDLILMLRLGQSPTVLAKQQFTIKIKGILSLPKTMIEADKLNLSAPVPLARQVFGGKNVKRENGSSLSRLPVLERKLVRFLLSASMEESDLGKALTASIAPTKSQLFIRAPNKDFIANGWIPRSSLKVARNDENPRILSSQMIEKKDEMLSMHQTNDSTEKIAAEEVDTLALGLSPLKRKALMSPSLKSSIPKRPVFAKKPIVWKEDPEQDENNIELAVPQKIVSIQEEMDAKRMVRMHSRLQKRHNQEHNGLARSIRKVKPNSNSRKTKCATLIIDLSPGQTTATTAAETDENLIWYASDTVLKACTL